MYLDKKNYNVWPWEPSQCAAHPGEPCWDATPPISDDSFNQLVTLGYLTAVPTSPIGGGYAYDNDGDDFRTAGVWSAGVNILLQNLATSDGSTYFPIIDKMIDNSDGGIRGKIRTRPSPPLDIIIYNVAPYQNLY